MQKPQQKPAEILERRGGPVPAAAGGTNPPPAQLGYAVIQVPSRGVLYDGKMPDGKVSMRKMMASEQARLQQQGGSPLERIEAIVNACTKWPEGFNAKQLLLQDSFFLLLALRTMSYGSSYVFRYKCRFCNSQERSTCDIVADLDERTADENLAEPFTVELVDAQCTVKCRFLRMSDQDLITKFVKRTKLSSVDADDPSYQYRLALCLVERNDEPFSDMLRKQDFVKTLTSADCIRLERGIEKLEPGVDLRVYPDCGSCGATNELPLPFDAEFFRPSSL